MPLPTRHTAAETTIFSVMSALAARHNAINLSQGFPDFPIDEQLGRLLYEASRNGYNQYAPMPGMPALRQAISADLQRRYGLETDAEQELTITPGATYAIYTALSALLEPGDEVIVLEPAYDSYIPNIEMNGARPVPVPLQGPAFTPDWQRIADALGPRSRAIIINTPHNPTGALWQAEDWDKLAELLRPWPDVVVVSDEVYEQLVFDGRRHSSVLQHAELRQKAFAIYSFGKVFQNTGWKMGYCIAPPELTQAFRRLHQYICFSVNTPAQIALAGYLEQAAALPPVHVEMQQRRDYFLNLMRELPFTIYQPAAGSYFQIAGYEQISDLGDMDFARWLTEQYGVATIPVSAFYSSRQDDRLIRFCFAKKHETLAAAVERMRALCS